MSINPVLFNEQLTLAEVSTIQNISGLGDPGADRILFWDESANAYAFLTAGTGLTITGTTIEASGSSGASTALDNLASVAINAALLPGTSDSIALGSATKMWSDLFLGDSAVINFNNGDVTLTHSLNTLTLGGGDLALGTNSLTMTGSLAATGARVTKGWFTDVESTNMPTVGGTSLSSTFAPIASPTFTGTVTIPTPFTVGATSVTSTGTQLNYLNAATGTTGTASTNVVFSTSPSLTTPTLGVASATSINKVAITAPATSATLTIADGKTLTSSNTITLAGTDATVMTFPTTSATIARTDAGQTFTGVQIMTSPKILTDISDTNGNELIKFTATGSAVNEITVINAATGNAPDVQATGGDTNIDLKLTAKGTGKISPQKSVNFGAFTAYFTETDNGNSSTADTIDWTLSNKQKSTLTDNCTFTFTAPPGPCNLILKLAQDGTGSRTVTWPAAVHWSGGTAPTLTTTASKVDIIAFYYDGSTYFGTSSLNYTA